MCDLEERRTVNGRENIPCLSTLDIIKCPKLAEFPIIPSITNLIMRRNNAMLIRSMMNLTSLSSLVIEARKSIPYQYRPYPKNIPYQLLNRY